MDPNTRKRSIKAKERDAIVRALRSGVVPRTGLQHIQVGRYREIESFLRDIENVAAGGTSFRIVIGEYGSGKTFFLSLARQMAMEKGLVTMTADLSPAKRLHGRDGQTRMLLSDLVASTSTRTRPDGGALPLVLERFVSVAREAAAHKGVSVMQATHAMLDELKDYPGGYAFARVVGIYCDAFIGGDEYRMGGALRWLRCEFATKTEVHRELGLRDIIDDRSFLNTIVLYSILVRKAGYKGLYICLDEMVNLYKITNSISRKANYEEVLNILNTILQGNVEGLGVVMGGTPEFLTDTARGLYSYEALRSRLAENNLGHRLGLNDYNSTVLRLANLTPEEMFLLLQNLRRVWGGDSRDAEARVPDSALHAYLEHCARRIGESYFRTPRNTIKGFVDLLSLLGQYPDRGWSDFIDGIDIAVDREPSGSESDKKSNKPGDDTDSEAFATFKL